MTLYELGKEYLENERRLRERAAELKLLLIPESMEDEQILLRRRLYYLMTEARDCKKTAEYLMDYHPGERAVDAAGDGTVEEAGKSTGNIKTCEIKENADEEKTAA